MSCIVQLALRPKRTTIRVVLHEPQKKDETDEEEVECPILQEPIASATLDRFPCPFLSCHPTYSAMTLPCGHTFHAMALTYHWARNLNVLCPVCRSGPERSQALAMNRLPCEWKYSMAARVRRERRRDRVEEEQRNHELALQHSQQHFPAVSVVPIVDLEIRLEAQVGGLPEAWSLRTRLMDAYETVVFEVLPDELLRIPYPVGTYIRLAPHTSMHILRPSRWFKIGSELEAPFSVGHDGGLISHIRLTLSDDVFACLVADIVMGRIMGGGESFQLVMLANEF